LQELGMKVRTVLTVLGTAAVALTACSSPARPPGEVSVVTSTNVWADVVRQVAGPLAGSKVHITSIINDPSADPHSYEADTRNQLAIKRADVVLENGGGYDDFVDTMLRSAGGGATVLNAVELGGRKKVDGEVNEHVWYDFPTVAKVADQVARALGRADHGDAATFAANAREFAARLHDLSAAEAAVRARYAGAGAAITEPVPMFLLAACGLVDRTPPAFSNAIEQGEGVAPRVLRDTVDLFAHGGVALLAYNAQTSSAETTAVRRAAAAHGVPVVPVTETLPAGQDYLHWMAANVAAVRSALERS
jgi:zinc/manganese transport system substrate-binding protein